MCLPFHVVSLEVVDHRIDDRPMLLCHCKLLLGKCASLIEDSEQIDQEAVLVSLQFDQVFYALRDLVVRNIERDGIATHPWFFLCDFFHNDLRSDKRGQKAQRNSDEEGDDEQQEDAPTPTSAALLVYRAIASIEHVHRLNHHDPSSSASLLIASPISRAVATNVGCTAGY